MAYGQNQPWGLQELKSTTSSYNAQTNTYFIESGYAYNIFNGDPVYLGSDGFIHSLYEQGGSLGSFQILGVFNGVDYTSPTSIDPIAPANPKRIWQGGSITASGTPASCQIIDDPTVTFNIQTNGAIGWNALGATASVVFDIPVPAIPGTVGGNFQTGNSNVTLDVDTIGTSAGLNLRILRFIPPPTQVIPTPGGGTLPYLNVEVLIQNHSFMQRAAGL